MTEGGDFTPLPLKGRHVLIVIGGGIAAYKSLLLIRLLRQAEIVVDCVLTEAGERFVTPLSVQALSGRPVHRDLWNPSEPDGMDHIRLPRPVDLVVVCPATADFIARMRCGLANDLATTLLLANERPVLIAPAMNPIMWDHPATQENIGVLESRGAQIVGPDRGDMACGDNGAGRLASPEAIFERIAALLIPAEAPLRGKRLLVTSGPTKEPIDPVRYLSNHSSGRQGHAIAGALAALGADVVLVSGPVEIAPPKGVTLIRVETALQMEAACLASLPVDAAVCVAAVADWRIADPLAEKLKRHKGGPPVLNLVPNPDILAGLSKEGAMRPKLVVGFAAETNDVVAQATEKRFRKGCDWIVANHVGEGTDSQGFNAMGGETNQIHLITGQGTEQWPIRPKLEVARRLALKIAQVLR